MRANCCSLKSLRDYSIPYTGLKLGKHSFEYKVNDAFFNAFEYSLVKKADLICRVELEKQETMLILNFDITGVIYADCDRCLAKYPQDIAVQEQQIAKFGEQTDGDDEEIIYLTKSHHEVDIAGLIYEYVNVALPLTIVCKDEGNTPWCDKEMLLSLKKLSVNDEQKRAARPEVGCAQKN